MNKVIQMFVQIWKWIVNNKDFLIALIALILTISQYVSSRIRNKEKYEIMSDKVEFDLEDLDDLKDLIGDERKRADFSFQKV